MPDIRISVKLPDMKVFQSREYIDAIARAQREKTAPELKGLFEQTAEGWKEKPDFLSKQTITNSSIAIRVYTKDPKYVLVVKGSPPHQIRPRRFGYLSFKYGYNASTRPRVLSSRANSRFGNYIHPGSVSHPGFEAREFDEVIGELYNPTFQADMQEAIRSVKS